ncbi:related to vacuolar zinc efflux protein [Cephalotrichum gorgonifer]|uniref:Related to vacuolar zinc efflux protein n=1 Tax=Cephalotrichum gorgonifer TaxID=2041049 RepID=A0AAE8SU18_9PEZI|nr:related to vacuolar zinc efflux protein [Cephalotrichum gorgonifer]
MDGMMTSNDTRGWIMCIVSAAACVLGSSVICVDLLIRRFPGKQNFSINENGPFLAGSLSLSFGVMLFSSLYSMLPTSKQYFVDTGYSDQAAGVLMVVWLAFGFIGIQIVSRLLHKVIPSRIVDCDHHHNHKDQHDVESHTHSHSHSHSPHRGHSAHTLPRNRLAGIPSTVHEASNESEAAASEYTPLLVHEHDERLLTAHGHENGHENGHPPDVEISLPRRRTVPEDDATLRRPPMVQVQERVLSFVKDLKSDCDETGPCYGYSDPCGQECFKHTNGRASSAARRVSLLRTPTGTLYPGHHRVSFTRGRGAEHPPHDSSLVAPGHRPLSAGSHEGEIGGETESGDEYADECCVSITSSEEDLEAQHHHHVPTNAFLSIGLQTSIAIALHKFPEGFITYATNHANPTLGFNVFMALFVHNISEGFTIALPLYMALGSRVKAMLWASLLGGLSQPLGAGVAALWFRLARDHQGGFSPNNVVYAGLFAVTAGIMVSVALQLFVEGLSLGHDRNLSIFCAFVGMLVLGLSNALVGEH